MLVHEKLLTAEEFIDLPERDDGPYELVEGRLVRMPGRTMSHAVCVARLTAVLQTYAEGRREGCVGASPYCKTASNPDTVRLPDCGYVIESRLPAAGPLPELFDCAPDIAVEVKSKGQTERELMEKVDVYLSRGARMVWVVRIKQRTLTIYRLGQPAEVLTEDDELDGGKVLPGFRYPLRRLFERL